jgi:hypothetical protein
MLNWLTYVNIIRIYAWAASHYWAHLAGISVRETLYLGSSIIVIIYPGLSAAIWGRDGMDGSKPNWMTLPEKEVSSELIHIHVGLLFLLVFSGIKHI